VTANVSALRRLFGGNPKLSDQHVTEKIGLTGKIRTGGPLVCCALREARDQQHDEVNVKVGILGVLDFNWLAESPSRESL
jgi:hypothetical protein